MIVTQKIQPHGKTQDEIPFSEFTARFTPIRHLRDPFSREYQVCKDNHTHKRAILKSYILETPEQLAAINQNISNYIELRDHEGLAHMIVYTRIDNNQEIVAAFDFSDITLDEFCKTKAIDKEKGYEVYLCLLHQMVRMFADMEEVGMEIDDIRKTNILVETADKSAMRFKLFFDERERAPHKSIYGLYLSPERLEEEDRGIQKLYDSSAKLVFQLGLLVLDVATDELKESYYAGNKLNLKTVQKKLQTFSLKYPNSYLVSVFNQMLQPLNQRPTFESLKAQNEREIGDKFTFNMLRSGNNTVVEVTDSNVSDRQFEPSANKGMYQSVEGVSLTSSVLPPSPHFRSSFEQAAPMHTRQSSLRNSGPTEPANSNIAHPEVIEALNRTKERLKSLRAETKYYEDGSSYYGEVQNNIREGIGIYYYSYGDIYFGEWKKNSLVNGTYIFKNKESYQGTVTKTGKHGFGVYRYSNGNIYQGYWENDLKHGKGEMRYPNGDRYDGNWLTGKKHGYGIYHYANGMVYEGNYAEGKKSGFGTIMFPDSTKFQGNWENAAADGFGKLLYENGDAYEGQFKQSMKHGPGVYRWKDATHLNGIFVHDSMTGKGRVDYQNGDVYEGSIIDGLKEGEGTYIYANKDVFVGTWRADNKHVGTYTFNDGSSFKGEFRNNSIHYGIMVYPSGDYYQGEFRNNQRNGYGKYVFQDGTICTGDWRNDNFIR